MRECIVFTLVLLCGRAATPQTAPAGWKVIKDAKAACQIAVPPEWAPLGENNGAAVFHDSTTAIAVVTSQPGQEFKPLSPMLLKTFAIPKEKLFENSARRIFYQDKTSARADDPNAFGSSVPGKGGTCSCHIVALPSLAPDLAKQIALTLSAAAEQTGASEKP
jgi:hypothetical protein